MPLDWLSAVNEIADILWAQSVIPLLVRGRFIRYGLADTEIHTASMQRKYLEQSKIDGFEQLDSADRRKEVNRYKNNELEDAITLVAARVHAVLVQPLAGISNVTEWAKKQACW